MVNCSACVLFTNSTDKIIDTVCNIHDYRSHTENGSTNEWEQSALFCVAACIFLFCASSRQETWPRGGASQVARKVISACIIVLLTLQFWKSGLDDINVPEKDYWKIPAFLVLALAAYKFSKLQKWTKCVSLLAVWLIVIVRCCSSVHNSIHLETYKEDVYVLLLPLGILCLLSGHIFLSVSGGNIQPLQDENKSCNSKLPSHPEDEASFLSNLFLDWVFRIVWAGFQKKLTEEEIPDVNVQDKCDSVLPPFEEEWKIEQSRCLLEQTQIRLNQTEELLRVNNLRNCKTDDEKHSKDEDICGEKEKLYKQRACLLIALIRTFGLKYFFLQEHHCVVFLWQFVQMFLNITLILSDFIYPLMIESLMKYVQNRNSESQMKGYTLIVASCIACIITDTMQPRLWLALLRLTFNIKMALTMAIYKKAMTLRNDRRKEKTAGQLVSLISEDLDKISYAFEQIYLLVLTPVQTVIAVWLLYKQLGAVAFLALFILVCLIPINYWLGRKLEDLEERKNDVKDDRVRVINEILNGIKVLKLYAWEESFISKICGIRDREIRISKTISLCYTGLDIIFSSMLFLVRFLGLVSVVILGEHLDSPKAFLVITLFMLLSNPFKEVAFVVPACVQARVSLTRISNFLMDKDIDNDVVTVDADAAASAIIKNGTFTWDPTQQPTLKNINLVIPKGGLVAVVGMVGSGKSSLLSAILGEMIKLEGKVTVQSNVAYVSQEAWIQNATLRENILFGSEFDAHKYNNIIEACALKDDFKILAAGDMTEIGERGINLSGGQKQRVSLARAVYSDADIFLFDDPLSAVDAHVGKWIFNKVIGHCGMLKNKTRVLVTHGVHWLPFVDEIVVMKDKEISENGSYKDLLSHNGAFAQFLKEIFLPKEVDEETDKEVEQIIFTRLKSMDENDPSVQRLSKAGEVNSANTSESAKNGRTTENDNNVNNNDDDDDDDEEKLLNKGKIIDKEDTEFGSVSLGVYKEYLTAIGPFHVVLFCGLFAVMLASRNFNALWVGKWTEDPLLANVSLIDTADYRSSLWMYVSIYALSGILESLLSFLFYLALYERSLSAATYLHKKLLINILHCPMSFFDTTPTGRIINRFSKDIESVDRLGSGLDGYIQCAGEVLVNLFMAVYITPKLIPFICVVSLIYIFLQCVYRPSARQLRRFKSKFSSPVFVHFKETLDGTQTLRAFKAQEQFITKMKKTIEERLKFDLMQLWVRIWFTMKISTLSQFVTLAAGLIVMWDESISPSHAGLVLSFSAWFVDNLGWYVQQASWTEQELVSLERVIEYSNKPQEAAWEIDVKSTQNWPDKGGINWDNYQARYRDDLDLVLRGVTCRIYGGEKIGIVGRTGAGKSSLTIALFRLVEAASGQIDVDDCQIVTLGLHDLRKKITILPQDPVIFGGTLKMNLDPFSEKSDEELWEALKHSHLQKFVESLPGKLDYECGEAGRNLSVGQRQLVCLARTLLRKTKVLVLDEATAAVDMETDDLIQKTICSKFKDCTVLTIAHRLNTVLEYDRILVIDQGVVKEFDSPKVLLANQDSAFFGMAREACLVC